MRLVISDSNYKTYNEQFRKIVEESKNNNSDNIVLRYGDKLVEIIDDISVFYEVTDKYMIIKVYRLVRLFQ